MDSEKRMENAISKIRSNYVSLEKSIVDQLSLEVTKHQLTTGTYRETVWKSLFDMIIPRKFCIEQGVFIIDSKGKISDEVDLVIFDEMYTPYIFNYGKIKFIPIEAVAVVVQCKSKNLRGINEWVKSIEDLETSLDSLFRTINGLCDNKKQNPKGQTATRPVRILCTTRGDIDKKPEVFEVFDIALYVRKNRLRKSIAQGEKGEKSCTQWYRELNHCVKANKEVKVGETSGDSEINEEAERTLANLVVKDEDALQEENVIMSLTFQLNQLLMIINNPMQFPHRAYVEMFNKNLETVQEQKLQERVRKTKEKEEKNQKRC